MTKFFLGNKVAGYPPPWAEPEGTCPGNWKNFIRSIVGNYALFKEYYSKPEATIQKELKKFNASLVSIAMLDNRPGSYHSYFVEFDSEHDYLLFLLIYSARKEVEA